MADEDILKRLVEKKRLELVTKLVLMGLTQDEIEDALRTVDELIERVLDMERQRGKQ